MAKVSNKKIKEIEQLSFVVDLIKKNDKYHLGKAGSHWTDTPPEMWNPEEQLLWDMMFENEYLLKENIVKILNQSAK